MGHVSTIAAEGGFLSTLARQLQARYALTPEKLADVVIYLPTQRACRELRQCWTMHTERSLLLPRLAALGEAGEQEDDPFADIVSDVPPVISAFKRRLLLARLIQQTAEKEPLSFDQALRLADAFATLQDEIQREKLDWSRLPYLVEERFSEYWQHMLQWLKIITHDWPAEVARTQALEPLEHRNLLVAQQVDRWKEAPPAHPIIIAGSTGSQPATRDLMRAVLAMPEGEIILPGLDVSMAEQEWQALEPVHPQWGMKRLLKTLEVVRTEVRTATTPSPRDLWIREIMRPVEYLSEPLAGSGQGVHRLEADTLQQEAQIVAGLAREALHHPGKHTMIVTRHRDLARRIAAELRAHHIPCDDSAGRPLSLSPVGSWMRLLAEAGLGRTANGLLSLLKHPLAAVGEEPADCRRQARFLEREYLRGHRRTAEELKQSIAAAHSLSPATKRWFHQLDAMLSPWHALLGSRQLIPLSLLISQHAALAETLAATPQLSGAERLWQDDAGRTLQRCLKQWQEDAEAIGMIEAHYYPAIFEQFVASKSYYPFGEHPRLHVLSPIEGRLLSADRIILCGMNEGNWPQALPADPWMNQAMRNSMGLPPQQQLIGQAAHDLVGFLAAPEVFITRATKEGGAPTTPCRWWQRMMLWEEAAVQQGLPVTLHTVSSQWKQWLAQEERTTTLHTLTPPAPLPHTAARPHFQGAISISDVKLWFKDPYAFYAKRSLKLRLLDELDPDPSRAEWGELLHALFKDYSDNAEHLGAETPLEYLMRVGAERLKAFEGIGLSYHLWMPRLEAICRQFLLWDAPRRAVHRIAHEQELCLAVEGVTLKGRADRIESSTSQDAILVDYKTGQVPSNKAVQAMREPQLPLEALMLLHHTPFSALVLEYWPMQGKEEAKPMYMGDGISLADQAHNTLREWIAAYNAPDMPYLASPGSTSPDDAHEYALLERLKEWRF